VWRDRSRFEASTTSRNYVRASRRLAARGGVLAQSRALRHAPSLRPCHVQRSIRLDLGRTCARPYYRSAAEASAATSTRSSSVSTCSRTRA
jgi:hypothetical protein